MLFLSGDESRNSLAYTRRLCHGSRGQCLRFARRNGRVLLGFRDRFAALLDALVHGARDEKKRELFSGGVDKKELLR